VISTRSLTGKWLGRLFTSSIFCLINTFKNNRNWWMPSQSEFNYSVCSAIAVHTVSISCREILCWWRNARALRTTTLPVVGTFQAAGALTQQEYLVWFQWLCTPWNVEIFEAGAILDDHRRIAGHLEET